MIILGLEITKLPSRREERMNEIERKLYVQAEKLSKVQSVLNRMDLPPHARGIL